MSQKNETLPLILALLITAGLLCGGFWWFINNFNFNFGKQKPIDKQQPKSDVSSNSKPELPMTQKINFEPPTVVPRGTKVTIEGSTSMVKINQVLKNSFEQQFPGTQIVTSAKGSNQGIEALLEGNADLAASSRPLRPHETSQGLNAIPVTHDAIAMVVSINNPFRRGLRAQQVRDIFQGKITDWSAVDSSHSTTIRVINRPAVSGTHQAFQELVLQGGNFGTTANIETMTRDATTPMLQALGTDGIGYATFAQVANQRTVRTIAINGITPEASNYPYQRTLFYVYKEPASVGVQSFLGYLGSPKVQELVSNAHN